MIDLSRIDAWAHGLDPQQTGRAVLGLGVEPTPLVQARSFGVRTADPIVRWSLDAQTLHERTSRLAARAHAPPGLACRVAVSAYSGVDVISRLREAAEVLSAFVQVSSPAGALRPRAWRWPLRMGVLGFEPGEADTLASEIAAQGHLPATLVDLRRIEDEPAAVDVLVTCRSLVDATSAIVDAKTLANVVVVAYEPSERWAVVEAQLATIRVATGAASSVLAPPDSLAFGLGQLVREMSHAEPLDVAVDRAWGGRAVLWAEAESLNRSLLPVVALEMADQVRTADEARGAGPPPAETDAAVQLRLLSASAFAGESEEASQVADVGTQLEQMFAALPETRWLQARVNEGQEAEQRLVRGSNDVVVWVGPLEARAMAAGAFPDEELPWDEAEAFPLTVVFAPLEPVGDPQSTEIELPRFGPSERARFVFTVPAGSPSASARILVLFRNRILQTAVLRGRVGRKTKLENQVALVPDLAGLDNRSGFDVTLLANHTVGGSGTTLRHSWPKTWVSSSDAVGAIGGRIADLLVKAADLKVGTSLTQPKARELLARLSVAGRDLCNTLDQGGRLGPFAGVKSIQVVTAGDDWFLPIEFVYAREAPPDPAHASVCERYLADPSTCGGENCPSPPLQFVCPNAFWGLSKIIERHRFNPETADPAGRTQLIGQPSKDGFRLTLDRSILGVSTKVTKPSLGTLLGALEAGVKPVASWDGWVKAIEAADTQLLCLLPHTNYLDSTSPTLEISKATLMRGNIEERYVTGGRQVKPVVILFGCRTTGNRGDPGGFASTFMAKKAAVVFHSFTDLKAGHAALLAERLTTLLRAPDRERLPLSVLLAEFRRAALTDGLLAGLSISAYGDADWRL